MTTSQRSAHTMLERDGGAEAVIPSLQHRLVELERHRPAALPLRPTSDDLEATYRALLELLDTPPGVKIQSDGFQGASQQVLDRLGFVLSSRRVKKGPGARPMSAKRAQFMELRARGWSVRAAVREVGVSRSCGANWSRGYKTYRNGEVVGFVAPLDRLAVREVSARYLSQDERFIIADRRRAGDTVRAIATGVARELGRGGEPGDVAACAAGRRSRRGSARCRCSARATAAELWLIPVTCRRAGAKGSR